MSDFLIMGIDLGTSVAKCVVFTSEGNEIAATSVETEIIADRKEYAEIDMDDLWNSTRHCIRQTIDKLPDGAEIQAIGVSGTASGLWMLDQNRSPLRRAILWNDGRAASLIAKWDSDGILERVFEIGGNTVYPGYPVALARWAKDNEPSLWNEAKYVLFNKDWIRLKLTGDFSSDISDLGYLPCDLPNKQYSNKIFELCGVSEIGDRLPPVKEPFDVAGYVQPDVAAELGIKPAIPVVTGLVDVAASTLGAGVYKPGEACTVLGTSIINSLITALPVFEPIGVGINCPTVGSAFIRSLVNTAGTMNIDWILKILDLRSNDIPGLESMVEKSTLGSGGLIYLPYLNTTGVVSPIVNPFARGTFTGLSLNHDRNDIARSVYEGLALSIADCYNNMPEKCERITVCGGGSRSNLLLQMIADCTGIQVHAPEWSEFGARGTAILAGLAAGIFADLDTAVSTMVTPGKLISPDENNLNRYRVLYRNYVNLRDQMVGHWNYLGS